MTYISDRLTDLNSGMGTTRDKGANVTYTPVFHTDQELISAYESAWLPRAVVDQVASDAFRKWRQWKGDAKQNEVIEKYEKRLGIRSKLERAMQLARLFGRAHVYFDLGDDASEPVNVNRVKRGGIRFATVLSRREVADGEIDDDPMSPYYGEPRYYMISSSSHGMVRIHPSRMITFYGAEGTSDLAFGRKGESILKASLSAIKRHDSAVQNVAHLLFNASVFILKVPNLADMLRTPEGTTVALSRWSEFRAGMGNFGLGLLNSPSNSDQNGEELTQFQTSFATLPDIITKAQEEVCAAVNIPRAILFGVSSGGLGSTGDLELSNYYDSVNGIQSNDIEPAMAIFDECLIRSCFGLVPDGLWYEWASLWQMSDKDKAEIFAKNADAWVKIGGILTPDVIAGPMITALVDAGLAPALDVSYNEFKEANGEIEPPADEMELDT